MVVPGDLFSKCSSPHTAAPDSACSQCPGDAGPRPAPSLTVTVCNLGQGTVLAGSVLSPWGAPLSLGAAAEHWRGHLAGPFLAQGPPAISLPGSAKLVQPALPSPLAVAKCVGAGRDFTALAQCP